MYLNNTVRNNQNSFNNKHIYKKKDSTSTLAIIQYFKVVSDFNLETN